MKKCSYCKNNKELSDFSKSKSTKDGLQYKCKLCEKETNKKARQKNPTSKYYNQNKEYYKEYYKDWIENNRDKWNKYINEYRKENLEKIREYQNDWVKEKYKSDINYKLKINIRGRILDALNSKNLLKTEKTLEYLGCSISEFKQYLEQQFLPEMNWENHGVIWEIDHINAIFNYDLTKEKEQFKAFHYTNTQPLFKTTEIAKNFGYIDQIGNRNKGYKNGILHSRNQ